MVRAARVHAARSTLRAMAPLVLAWTDTDVWNNFSRQREEDRIQGLVERLSSAAPKEKPDVVADLEANSKVAQSLLTPLLYRSAETPDERRDQLHVRMAMVAHGPSQVTPRIEEILTGDVNDVIPIRQLLRETADASKQLQDILSKGPSPHRCFRAALALAGYIPALNSAFWNQETLPCMAVQWESSPCESKPHLREALKPIDQRLSPYLEQISRVDQASQAQRIGATHAIKDYASNETLRLAQHVTMAMSEKFNGRFPLVQASRTLAVSDQGSASPKLLPQSHYPRNRAPEANETPREWPVHIRHRRFRLPMGAEWEVA